MRIAACFRRHQVVALTLMATGCYDLSALSAPPEELYVRSSYSLLCLHASASAVDAEITQDLCDPSTAATFERVPRDPDSYQLRLKDSTLCLSAADDDDNGVITLAGCAGVDHQLFSHDASSGHVTNLGSSKCLSVFSGSMVAGGVIEQYTCGNFAAQSFDLIPAPGSMAKKWHPGHYLRANAQSFTFTRDARNAIWDRVRDEPFVKGGLLTVPWGTVEMNRGVYDFTEIDADVATMKAMGKKLIIEVWWMNYWHSIPSTPQGPQGWLPDHVIASGCAAPIVRNGTPEPGYTVKLNRAECMDRLIEVYRALGRRYDDEPAVEQIIITEPSVPYAEWNADDSHTQFKRLIPAVAAAWPRTAAVFYMNWYPYSKDMFDVMVQNGVGVGGPDIVAGAVSPQDDGASVLQGLGGDKGTTDHRGEVPVSYSYEAAIKEGPPMSLIGYASNAVRATHLAWTTESSTSEYGYNDGVLPAIRSVNGATNTACPTTFSRCDTR